MAKNSVQKRQAPEIGTDEEEPVRRTKRKSINEETVTRNPSKRATRSSDQFSSNNSDIFKGNGYGDTPTTKKTDTKDTSSIQANPNVKKKIVKKGIARKVVTPKKTATSKVAKSTPRSSPRTKAKSKAPERRSSSLSEVATPSRKNILNAADNDDDDASEDDDSDGPSYWLMKAEPESRLEKGKDVKFSIDDLKNATEPEAWDGVRNATARNNMRAMMQGDMAFFYHSNCKKPGIAGTMEIVQEHSVDETAFDPDAPYYDEKSNREKPKWCVVHVAFRRKFPQLVSLKELQQYAKQGGVLANMQTLKMSRLSVSRVSKKEWDFIHTLVEEDVSDTAAAHELRDEAL